MTLEQVRLDNIKLKEKVREMEEATNNMRKTYFMELTNYREQQNQMRDPEKRHKGAVIRVEYFD
jgi:hypothetical protein